MTSQRITKALIPVFGAAAALAIFTSTPASAIPEGCTNLSGGSGSPNNGSQHGGTGTGAGLNNDTGGVLGRGASSTTPCSGGAAGDEVHSPENPAGSIGGGAGAGGVPLDQH